VPESDGSIEGVAKHPFGRVEVGSRTSGRGVEEETFDRDHAFTAAHGCKQCWTKANVIAFAERRSGMIAQGGGIAEQAASASINLAGASLERLRAVPEIADAGAYPFGARL